MGGILILVAMALSTLLWVDLTRGTVWLLLFVTLGYGVIGFVDDYKKIKHRSSDGLAGRWKLFWQFLIAGGALAIHFSGIAGSPLDTSLVFPFIPMSTWNPVVPVWLYALLALIVVVGTSNAVNLTDGLDGLAIGPSIVSAAVFLVLAYVAGTSIGGLDVAQYLGIAAIEGSQEMSVFCAALIGASVGFLWFNSYPALIFMGDVGSLALGGALGMLAILTKHELLSAILHGVFLTEIVSVMIQVFWFKRTGRRVFLMAPIHHHFEKKGWPEPRVIVRFWIVSVILALVALASLKLR